MDIRETWCVKVRRDVLLVVVIRMNELIQDRSNGASDGDHLLCITILSIFLNILLLTIFGVKLLRRFKNNGE